MGDEPFERLRARELIAFSLPLAVVLTIVGGWLASLSGDACVEELVLSTVTYAPPSLWMFWRLRRHVDLASLLGPFPENGKWFSWSGVVLGLIAVSVGTIWLVYYPLSYVLPELVEELVLADDAHVFVQGPTAWPFLQGCIVFVTMVVLAPLVEELLFRGFLLHRWTLKWGARKAVVVSSIIFGLLHVDILGAAFFGLVMASLYVRTETLWVPIYCHAANNFLVFLLIVLSSDDPMTIEEFREVSVPGMLFVAAGATWAGWYSRSIVPPGGWRLPAVPRPRRSRLRLDASDDAAVAQ